jgi:hypothetical protein
MQPGRQDTSNDGSFAAWAGRGFTDTIPIIPPLVLMAPGSSIPLDQCGKSPGVRGGNGWHGIPWRTMEPATREEMASWESMGASIGLRLGSVVAADIDVLDEMAAGLLRQVAELTLGESPPRIGQAPKVTLLYRSRGGLRKHKIRFSLPGAGEHGVELLAEGQQSVIDGVHPGTGAPYAWPDGRPTLADLPMVGAVVAPIRWSKGFSGLVRLLISAIWGRGGG